MGMQSENNIYGRPPSVNPGPRYYSPNRHFERAGAAAAVSSLEFPQVASELGLGALL